MCFPTFIAITTFQLLYLENMNDLKSLRKPEHCRCHGFRSFFQFLQLKERMFGRGSFFQKANLPCFLKLLETGLAESLAFRKI